MGLIGPWEWSFHVTGPAHTEWATPLLLGNYFAIVSLPHRRLQAFEGEEASYCEDEKFVRSIGPFVPVLLEAISAPTTKEKALL